MTTERSQAPALETFLCQKLSNKLDGVIAFFELEFCEFLLAEEYLKQNEFCLQH